MRITYGIFLEIPATVALPGIWEANISPYEHSRGLDPENFRIRQEIGRIENEQVTDENRGRAKYSVELMATRFAISWLRAFMGRELTRAEFDAMALVSVEAVENAPNLPVQGCSSPSPAIRCPSCQAPMERRAGPDEVPFWGCSRFPECRGNRRISK